MASTAWTATREELVRELARARAEREIAIAEVQTVKARLAAIRAERVRRNEASRQKHHIRDVAQAIDQLAKASRLAETIPPDPNAHQHCLDLLAALKEKP